jgi:Uracil DNA glycosylase superfamily
MEMTRFYGPRSMRIDGEPDRRRRHLREAHMLPLTLFAEKLRRPGIEVPDFDPYDGGVKASILFLFEKPGPMTALGNKRVGSGFVSRDNDDPTAEATFTFMAEAGIPRNETLIWNVVPSWNGTRKITPAEMREGVSAVGDLISLLPAVRVVVLVGRRAKSARTLLEPLGLNILSSDHPSPLVRARYPHRRKAIGKSWAKSLSHTNET